MSGRSCGRYTSRARSPRGSRRRATRSTANPSITSTCTLPERSQSARSLLLTLLGEYVLPAGTPAWTTAFVGVLGGLGVEATAARQALARTASAGWLAAERDGRRTRWRLTEAGTQLLSDGARRIYGFAPSTAAWDGRWLVLLVSVPERRREARHALRTRLAWAGFGSPAAGG